MATINVKNTNGDVTGQMELNDAIFGIEPNEDVMHRAVICLLANRRQGTSKAKGRSEVAGGGRKPYRQKGTGRARQGSTRAAQHVGGGVIFGPVPRCYRISLPKKMRQLAMRSALSQAVLDEKLTVLDKLEVPEMKTKAMATILNKLDAQKSTLILLPELNESVVRTAANIPGVVVEWVHSMNVFDLLKYNHVLMTQDSIRKIEEVYGA